MPRRRKNPPLRVLQNDEFVGMLWKEPSGAISFRYESSWLNREEAIPVSLSLPLRDDAFRGAPVQAVFENLLPDSEVLRRLVAERVGALGIDPYSLLVEIGRDCVGSLRILPEEVELGAESKTVEGEEVDDGAIEALLKRLVKAPLGLEGKTEFRISVAGAQEKTALLKYKGRWLKPHGKTPTSHLLKKQMGTLPNGMNLSNSVENEFYCLRLLRQFGLPVADAEISEFGTEKVLVVKRFDRRWESSKVLLRIPQEDCCQALSFPPSLKYQSQGGPGMLEILNLLKAADLPAKDQTRFIKAQILFWLMGATDGHAKNFSIFLGPGGRFELTPLYDVLSAQPSADAREIERGEMRLAMFVGDNRHYRLDEISGRHFVQTAKRSRLPESLALEALNEIGERAEDALAKVEAGLPRGFPEGIHESIARGFRDRMQKLEL